MNPETITFIHKMFNSDISISLKEVEVIARIKEDFKHFAEKATSAPPAPPSEQ